MQPDSAQALVRWIHSARVWGEKAGLHNMRRLLAALGNPQGGLRLVHVAGTNGKGSACAMVESVLRQGGLSTGLYTSPFLTRYNERIRLDGAPVGDGLLLSCGLSVYRVCEQLQAQNVRPTAFEIGTALAFTVFRQARVDVAVIETGLGGRLDATNVITPMACGIAAIGLDHMAVLGDTLAAIAGEKAGIIKPGVPVALGLQAPEAEAVLVKRAQALGAPLVRAAGCGVDHLALDRRGAAFDACPPGLAPMAVRINLPGRHQVDNARLALCLLGLLKEQGLPVSGQAIIKGLAAARWPARLEWVGDDLLLDGAHNPQGAGALADYLRTFLPGKEAVLLTAMMADKQPAPCARLLAPHFRAIVCTQVDEPRALPAAQLAAIYEAQGVPSYAQPHMGQALRRARALAGDGPVVVAGSLYLAGAVRGMLGLPE